MTVTIGNTVNRMSLRNILFANGTFSLVSGVVLLAVSGPSADFLGTAGWVPVVAGVGLLGWAAFVFVNARRAQPLRRDTLITIAGDLAWVIGAAGIILLPDSLSTGGKWALGVVSVAVLDFAVLQWLKLRRD